MCTSTSLRSSRSGAKLLDCPHAAEKIVDCLHAVEKIVEAGGETARNALVALEESLPVP